YAPGFSNTILYGINNVGEIVGQTYNSDQLVTQGVFISPPARATLAVAIAGTGSGTVKSTPGGIACPGDCAELFDLGTSVTLLPTPGPNSVFSGWSGDAGCSTGIVMLEDDTHCTATFTLAFRDVRRPGDNTSGVDLGGTGHSALNVTGSAGSA